VGVAFDAADEAEPDCAMDKRMDAADSTDAAAVADAVADVVADAVAAAAVADAVAAVASSAGKANDVRLRCEGGVPNSGTSRGLALVAVAAVASSYSVGGGI